MPIIDLQVRFRELGRIRIGQQVASGNGRKRPDKLEHFRLTSPSKALIESAAEAFGGTVAAWTSPAGSQWEVVTTTDTLDVVLLPDMALTQWNELWKGGGCERRCDGDRETLSDKPCMCPAEPAARRELAAKGLACKPTTRLSVMLPALPDIGIWRLETHGWYGATELLGSLHIAGLSGESAVRARLRLEQRETKRPGQPTMRYGVPVLELPGLSVDRMLSGGSSAALGDGVRQQVPDRVNRRERVPRPALPPGPPPPTDTAFRHGEAGVGAAPVAPPPPPPAPFTPPPISEDAAEALAQGAVTADGEIVEPAPDPFLDRLAAVARANFKRSEVASRDQKADVHALLDGLGTERVAWVLLEAFDCQRFADITSGQAQAVLEVAAAMGRDAFRDAWRDLADAIAVDDASGMGSV